MKIAKIAAICKRDKTIRLYDKDDNKEVYQWVGGRGAMYPLYGIPYMDETSIFKIFDIPESSRADYLFKHEQMPNEISVDDFGTRENLLAKALFTFQNAGLVLTLYPSGTYGVLCIDTQHLNPLSDVTDMLELYERAMPGGQPYIVAKAGMLVRAVIMPYDAINEKFKQMIGELNSRCALAWTTETKTTPRAEQHAFTEEFEICMRVDPSTGELTVEDEPTQAGEVEHDE